MDDHRTSDVVAQNTPPNEEVHFGMYAGLGALPAGAPVTKDATFQTPHEVDATTHTYVGSNGASNNEIMYTAKARVARVSRRREFGRPVSKRSIDGRIRNPLISRLTIVRTETPLGTDAARGSAARSFTLFVAKTIAAEIVNELSKGN